MARYNAKVKFEPPKYTKAELKPPTKLNHNPWAPTTFIKTLWLFSKSDFVTFIGPATLFGVSAALSESLLNEHHRVNFLDIAPRIPSIMLWVWATLMIFDLANQRTPESVAEDKINKPNRPIPSGRITCDQTRRLPLCALPLVLLLSSWLGPWQESALLLIMAWAYNDLDGGNENWVVRNALLALIYMLFNKGAMRIAADEGFEITIDTWHWLLITSGVIFTTMHIQDMKDQEGDRVRNRPTAPLVLGDRVTRWTLAIPFAFWSIVCPLYCESGRLGWFACNGLGMLLAYRILVMRGRVADKHTWWFWALWTGAIWLAPVM